MLTRTRRRLECIMTLLQGLNMLKEALLDRIGKTISQRSRSGATQKKSERYEQADAAYKDLQASGKPVDRIVGHSLGGSVALQMQQDHQIPKSRTFGAPVFDLVGTSYGEVERYRHPMDPVSVLDRSATWGKVKIYPHTYTGFEDLQ